MAEKLSRDLKDFLKILHKWRAQYLVIGAHAVGIYTEPLQARGGDASATRDRREELGDAVPGRRNLRPSHVFLPP